MSLSKNTAFARLSREMNASEQCVADALVASSALLHSAALAYRDIGGVSAVEAQRTFARLLKMNSGLIEVQGEAMRAHGQLMDIARETGATEEPTCPDQGTFTTGEGVLRAA